MTQPPSSPTIGVSIINYRTADLTIACVQSVLADAAGLALGAVRIAVVDNASGDGSADTIADWIADLGDAPACPVTLVRSEVNTGFSGGHNLGMAALTGMDHYLVLNSDAVLRPGCLAALQAALRDAPARTGFLVPRLEDEDGTPQINCFRFPGPASEFIRGANSGPVTRLLKRREVAIGPDPEDGAVEWASFACILLNAAMVAELGPMDEGYFLYYEDAEYCLRARRAGWGIRRAPTARVVHFRGGSGPVKSDVKARRRLPPYFYASRTRFLYQAHGVAGLWAANLSWLAGRAIAAARRLGGRPADNLREAEARDMWINIRRPLGPRLAPHETAGE